VIDAWRGSLRDRWVLFWAPRLISVLPWRLGYRLFRTWARSRTLFADQVDGASRIAAHHLRGTDPATFRRDARTVRLLEIADLYVSERHPPEWMAPFVSVRGSWPESPFVALTFHYGTGLWVCRSLRQAGIRSMFVSASVAAAPADRRYSDRDYGLRRLAEVERICGEPVAIRPGVAPLLQDALDRGSAVVGLVDIPPRLAPRGQTPVHLLGQNASLPDGLLQLAAHARVPVVPCWVSVDVATGRRLLVIEHARPPAPFEEVLAGLAATLEKLVRAQPAAWMFWSEWPEWHTHA
jgi:hypothetical protein